MVYARFVKKNSLSNESKLQLCFYFNTLQKVLSTFKVLDNTPS